MVDMPGSPLIPEPVADFAAACALHKEAAHLFDQINRAGVLPLRVHSLSSISAMAQLVEDGLGIATLPRAVVERLAKRAPLKLLPSEGEVPPLPIHLSWRDDPASPAHPSLVEQLVSPAAVHRKKR